MHAFSCPSFDSEQKTTDWFTGRYETKFYTGEALPQGLIYAIFDKEGTPFVYIPSIAKL